MRMWEPGTDRMDASPPVFIGADIGQKRDPTAVAVVEAFKGRANGAWPVYTFETRYLERLPLNTDYPSVADRIVEIAEGIQKRPRPIHVKAPKITIIVDATGVGAPVVDLLRQRLIGTTIKLTEATFTHGDRLNGRTGLSKMSVGKAYLVSRMQALFQTRRVRLPKGHPEAAALTDELLNYEIKIGEDANDRYGAFKTGKHDDLVTALGLAVLCDPKRYARARGYGD